MLGFISLLKQVNKSGITGLVTDANTGAPIEATIDIAEIYDQGLLFHRKADSLYGRFYRYLVPGNYTATISAPGYQTATFYDVAVTTDSLTVLNANLSTSAYVIVDNYQIDDDSSGASNGNGDGFINNNETIGLSITLNNQRQVIAKQVNAKLKCTNPDVSMLVDSLFLGNLELDTPVAASDTFLFSMKKKQARQVGTARIIATIAAATAPLIPAPTTRQS